jgi:hypothetical protein
MCHNIGMPVRSRVLDALVTTPGAPLAGLKIS